VESVVIYETYNPGAAVAIYAFDYSKSKWICLWSIFDERHFRSNRKARARSKMEKCARKFKPNLRHNDIFTNMLRVEFDHSNLDYYYEIDAIELIGYNFDWNLSRMLGKAMSTMVDELENEMQPLQEALAALNVSKSELFNEQLSQEQNDGNDELNLANLPSDVLFAILSYLDLRSMFCLRSTCKKMYELFSEEQLFSKLDLQPYWNMVNDEFLNLLSQLTSNITMLSLSWSKLISNEAFSRYSYSQNQFQTP
jgi:F-box/leucine-rich repeat protein 4